MSYLCRYSSPIGGITLASDGDALTGLWFDGQKYFGSAISPDSFEKQLPVFDETLAWLDIYFSGKDPGFTPRLSFLTTEFRSRVWKMLAGIPYGETISYSELTGRLNRAYPGPGTSPRAAAGAVSRNPISLIIPCHRVIGKNGSLTGYAGGIGRKAWLLALERSADGDSLPLFSDPATRP